MILLGRKVDAQTAREWGLAYDVVPDDELHDRAAALAATLAEAPTVAAGLAKWLINSGVTSAFEDHLSNEAFAMESCLDAAGISARAWRRSSSAVRPGSPARNPSSHLGRGLRRQPSGPGRCCPRLQTEIFLSLLS